MTSVFGLSEALATRNIKKQFTGDSIQWGQNDTAVSGWCGRLGIKFGQNNNSTVRRQVFSGTSWGGTDVLYTGSGPHEVLVRDGGRPGWTTANVNAAIANILNDPTVDIIYHGTGFNDIYYGSTIAGYLAQIDTFITNAQGLCPGKPIVITTETVASTSTYNAAFNALVDHLVPGESLPTSRGLLESTTKAGVWLMDTRQAFGNIWQSALMVDSLHPNGTGYQTLADWVYTLVSAQVAPPEPVILTTILNDFVRTQYFEQLIQASGDDLHWSVVSGQLPHGILLDETLGKLYGTPLSFGGNYQFTLRAENDAGADEQPFSGEIRNNALPFIPTTNPPVTWYDSSLDRWYAATVEVLHEDGVWRPTVLEC